MGSFKTVPNTMSTAAKPSKPKKASKRKVREVTISLPGARVPLAVKAATRGRPPKVKNVNGRTVIAKREFVSTLVPNSAAWQLLGLSSSMPGYDINPGCAQLFPWLSHTAECYEKYKFKRLSIELVSNNPSTMGGCVQMAVDYDYDDAPPSTEGELLQNQFTIQGQVYQSLKLSIDCKKLGGWKYTLLRARTNFVEPRTSYGGFIVVACRFPQFAVNSYPTFSMFVDYEVELDITQTPTPITTTIAATATNSTVFPSSNMVTVPANGSWPAISTANVVPILENVPTSRSTTTNVGVVQSGQDGTPILQSLANFATGAITKALDITQLNPFSLIAGYSAVGAANTTPATINSGTLRTGFEVFDSAGLSMGFVQPPNHNIDTTGTPTVPGANVFPTYFTKLGELAASWTAAHPGAAWNAAKFITPVIFSLLGASTYSTKLNKMEFSE